MTSILVVDDDAQIRDLLCTYLGDAGMAARGVGDGDAMWRALEEDQPDLIILDLMLPGTDGLSLCRSLVERMDIPVIMLTARGALIDRIVGLEMGADDYLAKPFDPRELLARIKVILRRVERAQPQRAEQPALLHFAGWTLDTKRNILLSDDIPDPLLIGGVDFMTLRTLLGEPYQTLSRDYLSQRIYGRERDPADRAIDMSISRLRQMLGDDARNPQLIRTVRNGGYVLSADVAVEA